MDSRPSQGVEKPRCLDAAGQTQVGPGLRARRPISWCRSASTRPASGPTRGRLGTGLARATSRARSSPGRGRWQRPRAAHPRAVDAARARSRHAAGRPAACTARDFFDGLRADGRDSDPGAAELWAAEPDPEAAGRRPDPRHHPTAGDRVHRSASRAHVLCGRHSTRCAMRASVRAAVIVLDMMAAAGLVSIRRMAMYLPAKQGWTGIQQCRDAVPLADELSRSPQESRLRLVWVIDASGHGPSPTGRCSTLTAGCSATPTSSTRRPASSASTTARTTVT